MSTRWRRPAGSIRVAACLVLFAIGPWTAEGAPPVAAPPVTALAFTPQGDLVVGSQAGLEVRRWPADTLQRTLPTQLAHVHDLQFSPDGQTLAAVGGSPAEQGVYELWSWPEGSLRRRVPVHDDVIFAVAWQTDASHFVTASLDSSIIVHARESRDTQRVLRGHSRGVLAAVYLPDNAGLVTAGIDESLRVWEPKSGALLRTLTNHTRPVHALAVRPGTGSGLPVVASISADRTVRLWQPTVGRLVRFARLPSIPRALGWTPDGGLLIVGCHDGTVRWIDPDTVAVVASRDAGAGVISSLAIASDQSVVVGGERLQVRQVVR